MRGKATRHEALKPSPTAAAWILGHLIGEFIV